MRDASTLALAIADKMEADAVRTRARITDEMIGLFLWHRAGIRNEEALAALINRVRAIIDGRARRPRPANDPAPRPAKSRSARVPVQLSFALETA
ncbi:hypothetical protein [Methylorubrum thiocyanatum]|uniref:hypothetical protein n=1 Tax=Methylorubrum thiocyanatum TaxID=47958 RepID=UPI00398C4B03